MPAKAFRCDDGIQNIPGHLEVATQTLRKNCMKASLPVYRAKLDDDNFDTILREGVRAAEKIIEQEMRRMGKPRPPSLTRCLPLTPLGH